MIIGIDYSMTSPAVCVGQIPFSYDTCKFMFITRNKKFEGNHTPNIVGLPLYEFKDNLERFTRLADITIDWIISQSSTIWQLTGVTPNSIGIEGYAFGAKGQVFNIGENTGILKYKLAEKISDDITVFAPSEIKKFATGKGNANKELMYEAFVDETRDNLAQLFEFDPYAGQSPVSDIIDSYYIAKYQHSNS